VSKTPKKHNLIKKDCLHCGKPFEFPNWQKYRRKYCSPTCAHAATKITKDTRKEKSCKLCGKKYLPTNWNQKYCSRECLYKARTKKKLINCKYCGNSFYRQRRNSKFCSSVCANTYKKGRTKGGKKSTEKTKRNHLDNLWSEIVKLRAGFRCEYCGKLKRLNSHHIRSRANQSTRWDLDNGICLCCGCHILNSTFSAHKTPLEFVEWLVEYRSEDSINSLKRKGINTDKVDRDEKLVELKTIRDKLKEAL